MDQQTIDKLIAQRLKQISDEFFKLDHDKVLILNSFEKENDNASKKKLMLVQEKMMHYIFQLDELTGASEQLREIKKKLVTIILEKISEIDKNILIISNPSPNFNSDSIPDQKSTNNSISSNQPLSQSIKKKINNQSLQSNQIEWICVHSNPKIYQHCKNNKIHFRTKIQNFDPKKISIEVTNKQIHILGISQQLYRNLFDKISLKLPSDYDTTQQISALHNPQKNILEIIIPLK